MTVVRLVAGAGAGSAVGSPTETTQQRPTTESLAIWAYVDTVSVAT